MARKKKPEHDKTVEHLMGQLKNPVYGPDAYADWVRQMADQMTGTLYMPYEYLVKPEPPPEPQDWRYMTQQVPVEMLSNAIAEEVVKDTKTMRALLYTPSLRDQSYPRLESAEAQMQILKCAVTDDHAPFSKAVALNHVPKFPKSTRESRLML